MRPARFIRRSTECVGGPGPRFPRGRFDSLIVLLHWLTLVLIATLIATGLSFGALEGTHGFPFVLWLHRSLGVLVWTITALRFLWRARTRHWSRTPSLPMGDKTI